jgi:hypothetical protein
MNHHLLLLPLSLSLSSPLQDSRIIYRDMEANGRFLPRWSVESKDFEMEIEGAVAGLRIRENCRGSTRPILLNRDETAWLHGSFENMMVVRYSRVFWNQSIPGFPIILAQRRSNRHGHFLVLEEFEGGRTSSMQRDIRTHQSGN